MAVKGSQFDLQTVSPLMDASLFSALALDGANIIRDRGNEFNVYIYSGLTVNVGTGAAIIKGRYIHSDEVKSINIPPNTSGYVVIEIDLTKTNTEDENNQLDVKFVENLTQTNINNGGSVYTYPLAQVVSDTSTISDVIDRRTFQEFHHDENYVTKTCIGNLCILTGRVESWSGAANSISTQRVDFWEHGVQFKHIPYIAATLFSASTGVNVGSTTLTVAGASTDGFEVRFYNNSSTARTPIATWIAIGEVVPID